MTPFLFASPDGRRTSSSASARRVHLRRLSDILHLSIQRGDLLLAQRSFAILSRCEDVEWAAIWKFGLIVLAAAAAAEEHHSADRPPAGNDDMPQQLELGTPKHVEFLRIMMLRHPEEVRSHLLFLSLLYGLARSGSGFLSLPLSFVLSRGTTPINWSPLKLARVHQLTIFSIRTPFFFLCSANRSCESWYCR